MVALLFWEPRRVKVMATKLAVLAAAAALLGVVAEGLWLLGARLLAADPGQHRGGAAPGRPAARPAPAAASLLVVLVGLLGFGVANLLRNTAAAFGFGFVYFAIVENVVRALRPHWQPYLLTDNAVALLQRGGLKIFYDEGVVDSRGFFRGSREVRPDEPARRGGAGCRDGGRRRRRDRVVRPARPGLAPRPRGAPRGPARRCAAARRAGTTGVSTPR